MRYIVYILFTTIFLVPQLLVGQIDRNKAKAAYEKMKAKGYDVDPRELTVDTAFSTSDSIAKIMILLDKEKTKYKTVEEAAMDVNRLLNAVSEDRALTKKVNGGLGFKIAQRKVINKEKDKIAKDVWEETVAKKDATVEDFAQIYERFGDKPTYYVNGYEVGQEVLNKIRESEVLTREYRVKNTVSGNPNGEIWYEITSKAISRIKFHEEIASTSSLDDNIISKTGEEPESVSVYSNSEDKDKEEKVDVEAAVESTVKAKEDIRDANSQPQSQQPKSQDSTTESDAKLKSKKSEKTETSKPTSKPKVKEEEVDENASWVKKRSVRRVKFNIKNK